MLKFHLPYVKPAIPSLPFPFKVNKKDRLLIEWQGYFTEKSKYETDPENQADWYKLCGPSFNPRLNAKRNSAMVGWRFLDGGFQLTPYYHNTNGKAFYAENLKIDPLTLTKYDGK